MSSKMEPRTWRRSLKQQRKKSLKLPKRKMLPSSLSRRYKHHWRKKRSRAKPWKMLWKRPLKNSILWCRPWQRRSRNSEKESSQSVKKSRKLLNLLRQPSKKHRPCKLRWQGFIKMTLKKLKSWRKRLSICKRLPSIELKSSFKSLTLPWLTRTPKSRRGMWSWRLKFQIKKYRICSSKKWWKARLPTRAECLWVEIQKPRLSTSTTRRWSWATSSRSRSKIWIRSLNMKNRMQPISKSASKSTRMWLLLLSWAMTRQEWLCLLRRRPSSKFLNKLFTAPKFLWTK